MGNPLQVAAGMFEAELAMSAPVSVGCRDRAGDGPAAAAQQPFARTDFSHSSLLREQISPDSISVADHCVSCSDGTKYNLLPVCAQRNNLLSIIHSHHDSCTSVPNVIQ